MSTQNIGTNERITNINGPEHRTCNIEEESFNKDSLPTRVSCLLQKLPGGFTREVMFHLQRIEYLLTKESESSNLLPHERYKLKVEKRKDSVTLEFTLPVGVSGINVLQEVEEVNPRNNNGSVVWANGKILDMKELQQTGFQATFRTTIYYNTANLTRTEQKTFLKERGEELTDTWAFVVALALYQQENGFEGGLDDLLKDFSVNTGETDTIGNAPVGLLKMYVTTNAKDPLIICAGSPL